GISPQLAKVNECNFRVEGQPVTLSGELPLEKSFWDIIKSKKPLDWRKASARLRVNNARMSAFQRLLPEFLSPQGQLNVNAQLLSGGNLQGNLDIAGARTRPMPNIGSIREIQLSAKFDNFVIRLQKASALIGGSQVSMSGEGDLSGSNWQK